MKFRGAAVFLRSPMLLGALALFACNELTMPEAPGAVDVAAMASDPADIVVPGSGVWSSIAAMPAGRRVPSIAALNGKLYAIGGELTGPVSTDSVFQYDPEADAWDDVAPLPVPLQSTAVAAYKGKLWVMGGYTTDGPLSKATYVYDPVANSWAVGPQLPMRVVDGTAVTCNSRLYVVGSVVNPHSLLMLDPATHQWVVQAMTLDERHSAAAACIDGNIYVTGGNGSPAPAQANVEIYSTTTNTWSTAPTSDLSYHASGVAIAGVLYVLGYTSTEGSVLRAYEPARGVWTTLSTATVNTLGGQIARIGAYLYGAGDGDVPATTAWRFRPRSAGNHPPTIVFTGAPYSGVEAGTVDFDADPSFDPDNDDFTYLWNFGDGATSTDESPQHTYASYGSYAVSLTATDTLGASRTAHLTVRVATVKPTVSISARFDTIFVGETFQQTGSFVDPGANTWTASVDYADGGGATPLDLSDEHEFALEHQYTAAAYRATKVAVSDGRATAYKTVGVNVLAPSAALSYVLAKLNALPADMSRDTLITYLDSAQFWYGEGNMSLAIAYMNEFVSYAGTDSAKAALGLAVAAEMAAYGNRLLAAMQFTPPT